VRRTPLIPLRLIASGRRAEELYELFVRELRERGVNVETGKFRAMMDVHLINWGPVTLMLDSKREF